MDAKQIIEMARQARGKREGQLDALREGLNEAVGVIENLLAGLRNATVIVETIEDEDSRATRAKV